MEGGAGEHLDDVVSEGVGDEEMGLVHDRVHQSVMKGRRRSQEELLNHAAAVAMRGDLERLGEARRSGTSMQCWTSSSYSGVQNDSGMDCRHRRITWLPLVCAARWAMCP